MRLRPLAVAALAVRTVAGLFGAVLSAEVSAGRMPAVPASAAEGLPNFSRMIRLEDTAATSARRFT